MNWYTQDGFADMRKIISLPQTFIICIGGRGTGKTYGALKYILEEQANNVDFGKFILMRRTQAQVDLINKPDFSPFKRVNRDMGVDVVSTPISKNSAGFYFVNEDGKPFGAPFGYTMALATISNVRGFDSSDVDLMIFDEFIPEKHDKPIRNEGAAFLNAYETINRNRELQGDAPLKCVLLANANNPGNEILNALGCVDLLDSMERKRKMFAVNKSGDIAVVFLKDSPISKQKKSTVLYRISTNDDFNDMSLDNAFSKENYEFIKRSVNIKEYRPIMQVGEITIYSHKGNNTLFVTRFKSGTCLEFSTSSTDIEFLRKQYIAFHLKYIRGEVFFADYYAKRKFLEVWP